MHGAKVAAKIRAQIRQFSGQVSVGLPKNRSPPGPGGDLRGAVASLGAPQ